MHGLRTTLLVAGLGLAACSTTPTRGADGGVAARTTPLTVRVVEASGGG